MKANRLALVGILLGLAGTVLLALFVTSSSCEKAGETAAVWMASDAGIGQAHGREPHHDLRPAQKGRNPGAIDPGKRVVEAGGDHADPSGP